MYHDQLAYRQHAIARLHEVRRQIYYAIELLKDTESNPTRTHDSYTTPRNATS
jgi:hypothetical protein